MCNSYAWYQFEWRGEVICKYKYREGQEGIHVTIVTCEKKDGEDLGKIDVYKTYTDVASMLGELNHRVDKYLRKRFGGINIQKKEMTFGEFVSRYFEDTAKLEGWKVRPNSTKDKYKNALNNQLAPKFGNIPIRDITAAMCEEVLNECEQEVVRKKGNKSGAKRRDWLQNVMSIMFWHARIRGKIDNPPIEKIKNMERRRNVLRRAIEKRIHPKSIDIAKLQKVWRVIKKHAVTDGRYMIAAIMLFLGPRNSAAAGVRFCDIEENGYSGIFSALILNQSNADRSLTAGEKNAQSHVKVPIVPELLDLIWERYRYIEKTYPEMTAKEINALTIACTKDDIHTPCNIYDIAEVVDELFKEAEVSIDDLLVNIDEYMKAEGIDPDEETPEAYTFRRNFSSLLFDLTGLKDNEAMYIMGHSREESSDRTKKSFWDSEQQQDLYNKVKRISNAFGVQPHRTVRLDKRNYAFDSNDETEVEVEVYLEKGEGVYITVDCREPHDDISIQLNQCVGMYVERANIQEHDREYDSSGANITTYLKDWFMWKYAHEDADTDADDDGLIEAIENNQEGDGLDEYDYDDDEWDNIEVFEDDVYSEEGSGENRAADEADTECMKREDTDNRTIRRKKQDKEQSEDKVAETYIIVLTSKGHILRLREEWIGEQNTRTKGTRVINTAVMGRPQNMVAANDGDRIVAITDKGTRCMLNAKDIYCPNSIEGVRYGEEADFRNIPYIDEDEKIIHICVVPNREIQNMKLMLVTNQGGIAKINGDMVFSRHRRKNIIKLREKELVSGSLWCSDDDNLLIISSGSHVSAQSVRQVPQRANVAGTVRGIPSAAREMGIGLAKDKGLLVTISSDGFGKATEVQLYHPNDDLGKVSGRSSLGKQSNVLSEGERLITGLTAGESGHLYLASSDGRILKIAGDRVPVSGRAAKGNKLMKVSEDSMVCCAVWRRELTL